MPTLAHYPFAADEHAADHRIRLDVPLAAPSELDGAAPEGFVAGDGFGRHEMFYGAVV
jgi:hypothetical protein